MAPLSALGHAIYFSLLDWFYPLSIEHLGRFLMCLGHPTSLVLPTANQAFHAGTTLLIPFLGLVAIFNCGGKFPNSWLLHEFKARTKRNHCQVQCPSWDRSCPLESYFYKVFFFRKRKFLGKEIPRFFFLFFTSEKLLSKQLGGVLVWGQFPFCCISLQAFPDLYQHKPWIQH